MLPCRFWDVLFVCAELWYLQAAHFSSQRLETEPLLKQGICIASLCMTGC